MRIPFCCSPRKPTVPQPPSGEAENVPVDPSLKEYEAYIGRVVDILRAALCRGNDDPGLPDTAVSHVIGLLLDETPPPSQIATRIDAMAKARIADLPVYERRMMSSWFARHRSELAAGLRNRLAAASTDDMVRCAFCASASLKAIGLSLGPACEVVSAPSSGPIDADAYRKKLSCLFRGLANADHGDGSLGERNDSLAELLEAAAACGGASRMLGAESRGEYHAAIEAALTDLEPQEFEAIVRILSGSDESGSSNTRPGTPSVLRHVRKHYDFAACELAKIKAIALSLRGDHDLASSRYARLRAARSLPLFHALLAGARTLDEKGDAGELMEAWRGMMTPFQVSACLKAPLFSDQAVAAFHSLHKGLYALIGHCGATFRRVVPDEARDLPGAMMIHFAQMAEAVRSGGPGAADAMVQSVSTMRAVLRRIHASLDQAADVALASALETLDQLSVHGWPRPGDRTAKGQSRPEALLSDLRLASDVATATGWRPDELGRLKRGLALLALQSVDRLTDAQRKDLRHCSGLGMPLEKMCDLAETVSAALPSILRPKSANDLAVGMKRLTNSVIALSHHVLTLNASGDAEGLTSFAIDASLQLLHRSFDALGKRHAISLARLLSQAEFRTAWETVARVSARPSFTVEGGAIWAQAPVTEGLRSALLVWAQSLRRFIDDVLQKTGAVNMSTGKPTGKQQARALGAIAAAWGIELMATGDDVTLCAIENAEFYVISGPRPRRAVLADFTLSGPVLDVCRKATLDPKTFSRGAVRVVFPDHRLSSGEPEQIVVSWAMWCDIDRAHFAIDDIIVDGNSFGPSDDMGTSIDPAGPSGMRYVETHNETLYRFFTALRNACSAEPAHCERQLRTVTALMNQTMAGGIHAVTTGQAIGYGWFGKGIFLKHGGDTMCKLRCGRRENSHEVRLEMEQFERFSILARDRSKDPKLRDLNLDSELSMCACHVVVDVAAGATRMPAGGATMKYALVEE